MPKSNKLLRLNKQDFLKTFLHNKKRTHFFSVHCVSNQSPKARTGISVPKRCYSRAVDRNRIRRIFRESFRHNAQKLVGFDVVVIVRRRLAINKDETRDNERKLMDECCSRAVELCERF